MTKGAFFHHFKTKEAIGFAAANYWSKSTGALFAQAPYHELDDPLDRVLAYLEFGKTIIGGDTFEYTCLVGTMTQEAHARPLTLGMLAQTVFLAMQRP